MEDSWWNSNDNALYLLRKHSFFPYASENIAGDFDKEELKVLYW